MLDGGAKFAHTIVFLLSGPYFIFRYRLTVDSETPIAAAIWR